MARPRRVEVMFSQLDKTSEEYIGAKDAFDAARVEYEIAREKFASVRRLASGVLSPTDWWTWRIEHEAVQYTGLKIGEAIIEALEGYAYSAAYKHWESGAPYAPSMSLEQLQETIERGGFEFRSTTALREVNGALLNLDRIERLTSGRYRVKDADDILKSMKPAKAETPKGMTTVTVPMGMTPVTLPNLKSESDDDDVPF